MSMPMQCDPLVLGHLRLELGDAFLDRLGPLDASTTLLNFDQAPSPMSFQNACSSVQISTGEASSNIVQPPDGPFRAPPAKWPSLHARR
jgi:hypothetical protein